MLLQGGGRAGLTRPLHRTPRTPRRSCRGGSFHARPPGPHAPARTRTGLRGAGLPAAAPHRGLALPETVVNSAATIMERVLIRHATVAVWWLHATEQPPLAPSRNRFNQGLEWDTRRARRWPGGAGGAASGPDGPL